MYMLFIVLYAHSCVVPQLNIVNYTPTSSVVNVTECMLY